MLITALFQSSAGANLWLELDDFRANVMQCCLTADKRRQLDNYLRN